MEYLHNMLHETWNKNLSTNTLLTDMKAVMEIDFYQRFFFPMVQKKGLLIHHVCESEIHLIKTSFRPIFTINQNDASPQMEVYYLKVAVCL